MRTIKICALIFFGLIVFLAMAFPVLLIIFEDKPPEHELDWSKEVDIAVEGDVLEAVYRCVREYTEPACLNAVNYRFTDWSNPTQSFIFLFPQTEDAPNGVLRVTVDLKTSRIVSVSAAHNESKMDFNRTYLDETLPIMSALALAEVERVESTTAYDVVDYMVLVKAGGVQITAYQPSPNAEFPSDRWFAFEYSYEIVANEDGSDARLVCVETKEQDLYAGQEDGSCVIQEVVES